MSKELKWGTIGAIIFIFVLLCFFVFPLGQEAYEVQVPTTKVVTKMVPTPYEVIENYTEKEPYEVTEEYTDYIFVTHTVACGTYVCGQDCPATTARTTTTV